MPPSEAKPMHTPGNRMELARGQDRRCGFCRGSAPIETDTAEERIYRCNDCGAVETIIKSKTSWWYCGWKASDGRKLRAPTTGEMTVGKFDWQPDNGR